MLQRIAQEGIAFYALQGDRDLVVPVETARDAAKAARGELVIIRGGTHSWVLRDPETLSAIVGDLLKGSLGHAYRDAIESAGLDAETALTDEVEAVFYEADAKVRALTPVLEFVETTSNRRRPSFQWELTDHRS